MAIVPPPVGPDENKLQYSYSFWFSHKQKGSSSNNSYEEMIKHIGAFSSVSLTVLAPGPRHTLKEIYSLCSGATVLGILLPHGQTESASFT